MLKFIPASELKKSYQVNGHFYTVTLENKEFLDCRSVLEITEKESTPSDINALSNKNPDAIFIMMNPGSSTPIKSVNNTIARKDINKLKVSLVPTKPDVTQYQVMRVMHYCKWSHVRVLNISDMRDPKSGKFTERFIDIEKRTNFIEHSIFSYQRSSELKSKLTANSNIHIICAWGVSTDLDPLINRCLKKVNINHVKGLLKQNSNDKYFHPLPTLQKDKELWVNNMVTLLKSNKTLERNS